MITITAWDRHEFARARMFDLWIGDWSKHEDNWKWAGYKGKDGEVFRPIPRDRDHAFSSDGMALFPGSQTVNGECQMVRTLVNI
jgi:hypothetical protein